MKLEIDLGSLFDYEGDGGTPIKDVLRDEIINEIANKIMVNLSAPTYELKNKAEKLIRENLHSLTLMGIEKYVAEKATNIGAIIDEKVNEVFSVAKWNDDGLPKLINDKITELVERKQSRIDSMLKQKMESNFKIILEELLEVAFKQFVEKAGINTVWVSGKERIKKE